MKYSLSPATLVNAAKLWLLEDEYEPIEGRLLATELV